ncbi:MAG: hypothetical protein ACJ04Q_03050 [Flavobacteriales bacterium]
MKKSKFWILTFAIVSLLSTLFYPIECNEQGKKDYVLELENKEETNLVEYSKIINFLDSICMEKFNIENHINMNKVIFSECNNDVLVNNEITKKLHLWMLEWDVHRIYKVGNIYYFRKEKVGNQNLIRPGNIVVVYTKEDKKNIEGKIMKKLKDGWYIVDVDG